MNTASYELKTSRYQGPIEKLVELIDEKKLPITEVSLAEVTADFLSYLEVMERDTGGEGNDLHRGAPVELLADFLVVASRLILIKSKILLPALTLSEEEEGEIHDLEARLRLYRELRGVQEHLRDGWREMPIMITRDFLPTVQPMFYPPPGLAASDLHEAAARLAGELERITRPLQTVRSTVVHLKEKIEEIIARVRDVAFSFGEFSKGRPRGEVVVLFLATLHLIKSQLVRVTQGKHFDDITIAEYTPDRR